MSFSQPSIADLHISTLIYGPSGHGKTVFAGSFPKPCIIDAEEGWKSIYAVHGYIPEVSPAKTKDDVLSAYEFLKTGDHDFETVIVDSLTDLSKFLVQDVVTRNPTRRRDSPDIPAPMDWMESGRILERILYLFRSLPMHVVFIAGEREFGNGQDAAVLPDVPPSLARRIAHLVDVTLYAGVTTNEAGDPEYVGQTVPARGRIAKDRSNGLPKPFMPLAYQVIADAFRIGQPDAVKPIEVVEKEHDADPAVALDETAAVETLEV